MSEYVPQASFAMTLPAANGSLSAAPEVSLPTGEAWTVDLYERSFAAAQRQTEALGRHIPEAAAEADRINTGAALLISEFQVTPSFFDASERSTIFLSLSLATAKLEEQLQVPGSASTEELNDQETFIASAAFLLTRNHCLANAEYRAEYHQRYPPDSVGLPVRKDIYADFEQPEVTARLRDYIQESRILDSVKTRMQIEHEAPFIPCVLAIGRLVAPHYVFAVAENGLTNKEVLTWEAGLSCRTEQFARRLPAYIDPSLPDAAGFAETDGNVYLPIVIAEMLLADKDGIVPGTYHAPTLQPVAILRHEYVHTQGLITVEDVFGTMLEECRAKHFSGDTFSYVRQMRLFSYIESAYGMAVGDIFDKALPFQRGSRGLDVYALIGREYGIESIAELAAVQPEPLPDPSKSPEERSMCHALGEAKVIVRRMIRRTKEPQEAEAIIARLFPEQSAFKQLHSTIQELFGGFF